MPWFTNKETGGIFNTDWLDDDYKRRYAQIHFNQEISDSLNKQEEEDDFTKELHSVIGNPKKVTDAKDLLNTLIQENIINPNYATGDYSLYHQNCALCTFATVLQFMGYDVEAMPRDYTWRGSRNMLQPDYSIPDNYMLADASIRLSGYPKVWMDPGTGEYFFNYKKVDSNDTLKVSNPSLTPRGAKAVSNRIIDKVHKWGNGAIGEISVLWKDRGSAHSVAVVNLNGEAFIYDSQSNELYEESQFERYFKSTTANTTYLTRLDNASFHIDNQNFISDLKKMVKRRKDK